MGARSLVLNTAPSPSTTRATRPKRSAARDKGRQMATPSPAAAVATAAVVPVPVGDMGEKGSKPGKGEGKGEGKGPFP
jgi:hypothetical protein